MVKGDVNKPKGKTSAYAFFVQTCREEHKRKHPEQSVNFAEFSKQCSERWRGLTANDKRRFEDMAKNDKVRYERDMRGYVPPKGMAKSGRRKKDPNAPKRPPSAFFVFSAEFRPTVKQEFPGCSIGETAKKLGIMWGQQTIYIYIMYVLSSPGCSIGETAKKLGIMWGQQTIYIYI
ncbi:high mobility group protein B2 isoform X2 [Oncorhynchus mykiss]|uniref:high mobility group protein B2 isoform X2 n=1 Tax=Oncorhynchus mykiss TaxID=8022 RepID=UPI00187835D6|nr:high mobility group protein B2 isoform X2 [Oncorhynchus mykiss]